MKVLFIQPDCRQYRVKLFDELSQSLNGMDLLHFGPRKFAQSSVVREKDNSKLKLKKFHWVSGLYKLVKSYDAVVVVFDLHWLNVFFLSLFFRNKIIYWGHGISKTPYLNGLRGVVGKRAKAIVTYDEKGKSDIVKLGIDPRKVFVANNTQYISNSEDLSRMPKNSFLFVGRIQSRKKVEDLLEAFSIAKNRLPVNTEVVVVGSGEHAAELKAKAAALMLQDSVRFVEGTTDDEVLKGYFSKAYAYVSPGHVGLGVLHSFAYGVPVITYEGDHHAPEYSNIAHNQTGKLVRPGVQHLAEALVEITRDNTYSVLGQQAYTHYTQNRNISQMVAAFQDAIHVQ